MNPNDRILEGLVKLEEKNRKLPPLSANKAKKFDNENLIGSVFYSNLLEGNTLSREDAIKAMFSENDGSSK